MSETFPLKVLPRLPATSKERSGVNLYREAMVKSAITKSVHFNSDLIFGLPPSKFSAIDQSVFSNLNPVLPTKINRSLLWLKAKEGIMNHVQEKAMKLFLSVNIFQVNKNSRDPLDHWSLWEFINDN